jgi:hypothetical protein
VSRLLKKAERCLAKADELLFEAHLINDYLEVFYDQKLPPSVEWNGCMGGVDVQETVTVCPTEEGTRKEAIPQLVNV